MQVTTDLDKCSPSSTNLLLGTAAQESGFGKYIKQIASGPARGVFQMEPATYRDIWRNYLVYKHQLAERVLKYMVNHADPVAHPEEMEWNLALAICMARVHYLRVRAPLPAADDVWGMATYWKDYYNTRLGKGTIEEFVDSYRKYVG
jgi:hypothetical protein